MNRAGRLLCLLVIPAWIANGYHATRLLWPINRVYAAATAGAFFMATADAITKYLNLLEQSRLQRRRRRML